MNCVREIWVDGVLAFDTDIDQYFTDDSFDYEAFEDRLIAERGFEWSHYAATENGGVVFETNVNVAKVGHNEL